MSMNKPWKVVLVFAGVFLAGVVCGGPLLATLQKYRYDRRLPFIDRTMGRYEHELGITSEQKERIRPILIRIQKDWRQLKQENVRNLLGVIDRMYTEIGSELTPEQRIKLEKMREESRARTERLQGRQHEREERQDRKQTH
jgi:uncharacterized membrane protein